jgi:hypothetical protein
MACYEYKGKKYTEQELRSVLQNEQPKVRRVLELQSDLFQKGRNKEELANVNYFYNNLLLKQKRIYDNNNLREATIEELNDAKKELSKNQFLQLLNKKGNWINFFVQSIVQDSAKKGYEKVLFPKGDTASKIEGHTTLEEFKKQKEDRIKELEKEIKEGKHITYNYYLQDGRLSARGITKEKLDDRSNILKGEPTLREKLIANNMKIEEVKSSPKVNKEITQLKEELKRIEEEGFGALKPIYDFYENRLTNILKKLYSIKEITDEYGNTWNEISIENISDKVKTILLSKNNSKETELIHSILKVLRGQNKLDIQSIKDYIKSADLDKKQKKRRDLKISRYNKGGKFQNASTLNIIYHAIEELNELVQNPTSKEEQADVVAQLTILLNNKKDIKKLNLRNPLSLNNTIKEIINPDSLFDNDKSVSVSEIHDMINNNENISDSVRALNDLLKNVSLKEGISDVKIESASNLKLKKEYGTTDDIFINGYAAFKNNKLSHILINNDLNKNKEIGTVLHEILHGVTVNKIRNNTEQGKLWNNFFKQAKQKLIDNGYDPNSHELSNAFEFLSGIFTDKELQEKMKQLDPIRSKSLINNLINEAIDLIKRILGFKGDITLLEDAILMGSDLITEEPVSTSTIELVNNYEYPVGDSYGFASVDKFNPEYTDIQKEIQEKIEKTKELSRGQIYMTSDELISKVKKSKNIKTLTKVKDGLTRNIIWDEKEQKEIIVSNRPSDQGQLLFAKAMKWDKERINQGNNDRTNIIKRGMGTTLHYIMEHVINELDRQNSDFSLLKPDFGKMGSWNTFYLDNINKFKESLSKGEGVGEEMNEIFSNIKSTSEYKHIIDQGALIDPVENAPELSEEERTFIVDNKDFEELIKLAFKTYFNIYRTQADMKWDSTTGVGRPMIITEAPVYSKEKDVMGSIDLLVIYDNGKVGHFDWKFMSLESAMKKEKLLPAEIIRQQKLDSSKNKNNWGWAYVPYVVKDKIFIKKNAFDAQVSTYKNILTSDYGINSGDVVQSRVIPVNMFLGKEETGEEKEFINKKGKKIKYKVKQDANKLQFLDHTDKLLEELSLANELTGDKDLDPFINDLYKERDVLQIKIQKDRNNQSLKTRLENVEYNIKLLSVNKDIATVAKQIIVLAETVTNNLSQPRILIDKKGKEYKNKKYLEFTDLNELEDVFKLYSGLMSASENSLVKLEKLKETDKIEALKSVLIDQDRITTRVLKLIAEEKELRLLDSAKSGKYETDNNEYDITVTVNSLKRGGVGVSDRTAKYSDINLLQQNFTALSQMNHPHLRMYKNLLDNMNVHVKEYIAEVESKIKKASNELKEWGKARGESVAQTYEHLIDKETGNLISKQSAELKDRVKKARKERDIKWLKENLLFDQEAFMKRRNRLEEIYRKNYGEEEVVTKKLLQFDEANDMNKSDYAYLNSRNINWNYNPELLEQYKNPKWDFIQENEPLKNFYEMHLEIMKDIRRNIIGENVRISEYFVANIHKDIVDNIVENGAVSMKNLDGIRELVTKSIVTRENDEDFGYTIDDEVIDEVPLRYRDNVPGGVKNKSKDLAKSLLIFAYSAKSYQTAKELEGISNAIRRSLVSTKLLVKDISGKLIEGKTLENTEESKLVKALDGYIKQYIYGQSIQSGKDVLGGKTGAKILSDIMSVHSKANLALNHLSLIGGHLNAKAQAMTEANKGKHFTKKQWREAEATFAKFNPKSRLVQEFFEVTAEGNSGLIWEKANKVSISTLRSKYNKSLGFHFQRKSDDAIDSVYLVAMMKNYVLHPNGIDVFPKGEEKIYLKGTEYEGQELTTMWEAMQLNKDPDDDVKPFTLFNGSQEGEITRTQFIKFRNKVRKLAAKAKGNYNSEDAYLYKTNMLQRLLMQYRGWIPAFVMERFRGPTYDFDLEEVEIGRWQVAVGEITANGTLPAMRKFAQLLLTVSGDALTFNKFNLSNPSEVTSKMYFDKWKKNNPGDYEEMLDKYSNFPIPEDEAFKEWHDARKGELRKLAAEIRAYLLITAAMIAIAFGAGDDEEKENPFVRNLVQVLDRAQMEIGFFFSPTEMGKLLTRSPIPVYGIVQDAYNMLTNTLAETKDYVAGVESDEKLVFIKSGNDPGELNFFEVEKDKTPPFKYLFRLVPGIKGVTKFLEISDQSDEKVTFYDYIFGSPGDNKTYKK